MKRWNSLILSLALALSIAASPVCSADERVAADPNAPAERGAVIQTLFEREGRPAAERSAAFADTAGTWYADAAAWAMGNGIVSGDTDGCFHGERAATRAEAAAMLYRYAQSKGLGFTGLWAFPLNSADADEVPDWAYEATAWCVMKGVMTATVSEQLASAASVTRAELAAMLDRLARVVSEETALSLWTDGAAAKDALLSYMKAVTDEGSADYIPVEDRIAVFDLDGTLFCETDPGYFDHGLLYYRVMEDPDYKDKASDTEREVAERIGDYFATGDYPAGMDTDHGKAVASAFKGMTIAEFNAYVQAFKKQPMPSYDGMRRGDGWYLPMLQVVEFLKANDFTVYVVSGTDRLIVRGLVDGSPLGLPNSQLIGSDETIVSSGQNGEDGLNYQFKDGEDLILGGDFLIKNLKMNKVSVIMQEIGTQPVLSFGNSTGDSSMAEYVTSSNPHRSLAFMLCCDDTERENGNETKAQKMFDLCEKYDWVPVSMKNDWTTIYGPNVVRK